MLCSVIVLNYFGEKVLDEVLNSLLALNFPEDQYEIIVVDNNSKDKSREILNKFALENENIKLIYSDSNLGFSKGNNLGINEAKGEYIALLNNDCVADPDWLSALVKTAKSQPNIFAVNSKILLYPKYLRFDIKLNSGIYPLYAWLSKSNLYQFNPKRMHLALHGKEDLYKTEVPFDPVADKDIEIEFLFNIKKETTLQNLKREIKFSLPAVKILKVAKNKSEVSYKISINLTEKAVKNKTFSRIQNVGTMPFQDGYARDIGSIIRFSTPYYESDEGQYDKDAEVYAFCGAATLLNRKILEKTGYLDESFFMYYEDIELSERARLNGYKIVYSHGAVVRHIHALSSNEGSSFFVYNVEKGRMLHVFYNFPARVFWEQYFRMIAIITHGGLNMLINFRNLRAITKDKNLNGPDFSRKFQLIKVLMFFSFNYFYLLYLKSLKKLKNKNSVEDNYNEILSGRWYFK